MLVADDEETLPLRTSQHLQSWTSMAIRFAARQNLQLRICYRQSWILLITGQGESSILRFTNQRDRVRIASENFPQRGFIQSTGSIQLVRRRQIESYIIGPFLCA